MTYPLNGLITLSQFSLVILCSFIPPPKWKLPGAPMSKCLILTTRHLILSLRQYIEGGQIWKGKLNLLSKVLLSPSRPHPAITAETSLSFWLLLLAFSGFIFFLDLFLFLINLLWLLDETQLYRTEYAAKEWARLSLTILVCPGSWPYIALYRCRNSRIDLEIGHNCPLTCLWSLPHLWWSRVFPAIRPPSPQLGGQRQLTLAGVPHRFK